LSNYLETRQAVSTEWLPAFAVLPLYCTEDSSFDVFVGLAWCIGTGPTLPANVEDRALTLAGLRGRYGNRFTQVIPLGRVTAGAIITSGVTFAAKELF